jgi:hypothetical protein
MNFYSGFKHERMSISMNLVMSKSLKTPKLTCTRKSLLRTPFHDVPFHEYIETFLAMVKRNDKFMVIFAEFLKTH